MGFFASIIGCKSANPQTGKAVFPKESFSVIEAQQGDKKIVGSINMAYREYTQKANYPWCLTISVALDEMQVDSSGLPSKKESDIAYKMEDEFLDKISEYSTSHFIGHLFNDSFLDIYIYLDKPEKVQEYLNLKTNKEVARPFKYTIEQDPAWHTVSILFPPNSSN